MSQNRMLERRMITGDVEVRSKGTNTYVEGYASVFNSRSGNLGGFVEKVRSTAFNKTIKEADVRALWNHDPQYVLGRTGAGTLELSIDDNGLYYRSLLPNTGYAKDLAALMERGDVRESSFTFFKVQDDWAVNENGEAERSLIEVGLIDVAPVTFPAYPDATSGVARRNALMSLAKRCGIDGCKIESELDSDEAIQEAIQRLNEPDSSTNEGEPLNSTRKTDSPDSSNSTQQSKALYVPNNEFADPDFMEKLLRGNK